MGKYLDLIRSAEKIQDKEPVQGRSSVEAGVAIAPGARITWQVAEGPVCGPASVDFVHRDPNGAIWVFYTVPHGTWGAVHAKWVTVLDT